MNLRQSLRSTNALGMTIREIRTDMDMGQVAFANLVPMNRVYLSQIERGIRYPTILILAAIMDASRMTPAAFLERVFRRAQFDLQYPTRRLTVQALSVAVPQQQIDGRSRSNNTTGVERERNYYQR
jgi:transcriptional regulator with XRE-family HTH domain